MAVLSCRATQGYRKTARYGSGFDYDEEYQGLHCFMTQALKSVMRLGRQATSSIADTTAGLPYARQADVYQQQQQQHMEPAIDTINSGST